MILPYRLAEGACCREAVEDVCDHCHGYGEVYVHADDCDNDYCALAGGMEDCLGKVEDCPVCEDREPTR